MPDRRMIVLVTDGTGFLGRRVVQVLVERGHEVWVPGRHSMTDACDSRGEVLQQPRSSRSPR